MQKLNQQVHQKGKVKGFRRCWKAVGILSFCFFLLLCSDIQAAEPKHVTKEKKVLFINSYGYDWESTQMQIDGVERALQIRSSSIICLWIQRILSGIRRNDCFMHV